MQRENGRLGASLRYDPSRPAATNFQPQPDHVALLTGLRIPEHNDGRISRQRSPARDWGSGVRAGRAPAVCGRLSEDNW